MLELADTTPPFFDPYPRPTLKRCRLRPDNGQRILDTMFPIAKGGTAAVPGGFGTGKTADAASEYKNGPTPISSSISAAATRANEMTRVLEQFQELVDPKAAIADGQSF